jgi:hypothetical protein
MAIACLLLTGCHTPWHLGPSDTPDRPDTSDPDRPKVKVCQGVGDKPPPRMPQYMKPGVTIIPLRGAKQQAAVAAHIIQSQFDMPITVYDPIVLPRNACDGHGQIQAEPAMDFLKPFVGVPPHAVLVISADDLGSSQYDWQFATARGYVGLISTYRFDKQHDGGGVVERVMVKRFSAMLYRYVLTIYHVAPDLPDTPQGSLLTPMYSYEQLDQADDVVCPYRKHAQLDPESIRCPGKPVKFTVD